jgi:hypothetical protein
MTNKRNSKNAKLKSKKQERISNSTHGTGDEEFLRKRKSRHTIPQVKVPKWDLVLQRCFMGTLFYSGFSQEVARSIFKSVKREFIGTSELVLLEVFFKLDVSIGISGSN